MGELNVDRGREAERMRAFVRKLLDDVNALEVMLAQNLIEDGVWRIGAEQELFLIDSNCRPALTALEVLQHANDPHLTTELGRFNLEFNLDPLLFRENCFSLMEQQLHALLQLTREAARKCGSEVFLIGILPTLRKSDLSLAQMTPKPRYFALNEALRRMRGEDYELFLRGTDELYIKHDSVMLEACNTSFQVHFQVGPQEFARYYNIAQAIAGPVLALAVNSPLLFGKRLWQESRIALFQQAVDTRQPGLHMRESMPRVSFGNGWVRESVLEIFQEDVARFRVIMGAEIEENPFEVLQGGGVPRLRALQLHNGTVYRWNRPCYGVTEGKPHLRIENRMFPAGPTPVDEVANAAFWLGLVVGLGEKYQDIRAHLEFDDAKANFIAAARLGAKAQMTWLKNKVIPAQKLVLQHLLPLAHEGLQRAGVLDEDRERYLEIIKARATRGQTGADWLTRSFAAMKCEGIQGESLCALVASAFAQQTQNVPIHEWPAAKIEARPHRRHLFERVEQFMTTDIFTVGADETIELVLNVMTWRRIRHIPVEDENNRLIGLVNYRSLLDLLRNGFDQQRAALPVSSIMQREMPTIAPMTTTLDALHLMRKTGETCLPVVHEGRLVGIITQNDFMKIAAHLLETTLPGRESFSM